MILGSWSYNNIKFTKNESILIGLKWYQKIKAFEKICYGVSKDQKIDSNNILIYLLINNIFLPINYSQHYFRSLKPNWTCKFPIFKWKSINCLKS